MPLFILKATARLGSARICSVTSVNLQQVAGITSAGGKPRQRNYKTFDYRNKRFTHLKQPFDRSHKRFDENSKVIVIEGPIGSGKHEFGQKLAKELDFKFVPQSSVSQLYKVTGSEGLTYQDLDELLPPKYRIYDLEAFFKDEKPKLAEGGGRVSALQLDFFTTRLYTYNDALLHLHSTGQGVVCVRSPWSDRVFAKALYENGYMSRTGYNYYADEICHNHLCDFPRPHLTIYLDASVDETLKNIQKKNRAHEATSKVLNGDFLQSIENEYKDSVLPHLESHGEMLVYPSIPNITEHEVSLMVEDIEALGPMQHSGLADDDHLKDWADMKDKELAWRRRMYQDLKIASGVEMHARPWHAPEMLRDEDWEETRAKLYHYQPGYKYQAAFDPELNPWWKIALGIPGAPQPKERRHFWLPA